MAMVTSSFVLSIGKWNATIPQGWAQNIGENIRSYVEMAKDVSGKDVSGVSAVVFGMVALSRGYSSLARSLEKLNGQIEKINVEKLNALKSMTGSVVLLSLMDPGQFESVMDAFESRAGVFVETINDLTAEKPNAINVPALKTSTGGGERAISKTMDDLYGINAQLLQTIQQLSGAVKNISDWADEKRATEGPRLR
jgi:hypothetical protein